MTLLKGLSIYTLSSLVSRAIPFLMLPIMTSYLSPEQYGVVAVVTVLIAVVSSLLFVGIHSYLNVEYFKLDKVQYKQLFRSLIPLPYLFAVPLSGLLFVYCYLGGGTFGVPEVWFILVPLLAVLTLPYRLLTILYRVKEQASYYGLVEVLYSFLQVGLALLLVVFLDYALDGRLWAVLISSLLIGLVAALLLLKDGLLFGRINSVDVKKALKYGISVIPHEVGTQIIRMGDRLLVSIFLGVGAAGLYSVAAQVASIALVFISVFNLAWQPYVFKNLSKNCTEAKLHLVSLSKKILFGFAVFFLIIQMCVPFIYQYFINDAYQASIHYVPWLLLGFYFLSVSLVFSDYIFYVKKMYMLSWVTAFNLLLLLLLSYLLLPRYGAIGSAYAFVISSGISSLLTIIISVRVYEMPWLRLKHV